MASIKDIAKEAKTSISSVSLVLNGKAKSKRISDVLAERIKEAAERLGYHPNLIAVGLRTGKSKTVALVVEDISNHFFSTLAKTIEDEAKAYGYNVVFCSTENNVTKGKEVIRMLRNQQMDGYLITAITGIEKEIVRLVASGRPVVLMDGYFKESDIPYVIVSNFQGMQNGIELLIKKGYKNIGYVTVDQGKIQILERENAWRQTLKKHKLKCGKNFILEVVFDKRNTEAQQEIENFLLGNKELDCIVFATNYLGILGLKSIRNLKIKVPETLGVLCFDDHDIFELHTPAITVIQQPIEQMAKSAINILMGLLNVVNPVKKNHIELSLTLKERESLRK
jgi:LacI family transcriptional regulator